MSHNPVPAVAFAALLSGPAFCFSHAAADLYLRLPQAVPVGVADVGQFLAVLLPATVFGFFIGFIPNLLGATAMRSLAAGRPIARTPFAWAVAGVAAGTGIAWLTGASPAIFFALVATSAFCALVCRWRIGGLPSYP